MNAYISWLGVCLLPVKGTWDALGMETQNKMIIKQPPRKKDLPKGPCLASSLHEEFEPGTGLPRSIHPKKLYEAFDL